MMPSPSITLAIEGLTDEYVMRRIFRHVGLVCNRVLGRQGKPYLLQRLPNFNKVAQYSAWIVVLDLDRDSECAPAYAAHLLPDPSQGMFLRIAVRAIESWVLADREKMARFLGIAVENVPKNPDTEGNPKRTLIELAKRSRRRKLRDDIIPRPSSGRKTGPGYAGRINEFVATNWRPEVAVQQSDSLRRCIAALRALQ